jgi:hypothetical protein
MKVTEPKWLVRIAAFVALSSLSFSLRPTMKSWPTRCSSVMCAKTASAQESDAEGVGGDGVVGVTEEVGLGLVVAAVGDWTTGVPPEPHAEPIISSATTPAMSPVARRETWVVSRGVTSQAYLPGRGS